MNTTQLLTEVKKVFPDAALTETAIIRYERRYGEKTFAVYFLDRVEHLPITQSEYDEY